MRLFGRCVLVVLLAWVVVGAAGCTTPQSSVTLLRQPVRRFPSSCPVRLYKTQPAPADSVAIVRLQATCRNDSYDRCVRWLAAKTCEAGGNVLYDVNESFVTHGRHGENTELVMTALGGYSAWAENPQTVLPQPAPAPPAAGTPTAAGQPPIAPASAGAPIVPATAGGCVPECRQGYECAQGQCVSSCNPPCPTGERCVGHGAAAVCEAVAR